nr:hypothetical protein [Deltaproteobacteria bacterium]
MKEKQASPCSQSTVRLNFSGLNWYAVTGAVARRWSAPPRTRALARWR